MTTYNFYNGDILTDGYARCVGWISDDLQLHAKCIEAIKNELEKRGHELIVDNTTENNVNSTPANLYTKYSGSGYNVGSHEDDFYYAYFSEEMKCAKSCASAVLKVISV